MQVQEVPIRTLTWEECPRWRSLKRRISQVVEVSNGMITGNGGATVANSLLADWVLAHFENREAGIWTGTANAGGARRFKQPLPFCRYRRRQGASGPFGRD